MTMFNLRELKTDQSGVSVTEFGLIAPAVITMLLGTMDVGHTLYMRTIIDGTIQEIARDSALEDGRIEAKKQAIDAQIKRQIRKLNNSIDPEDDIKIKRRYYRNFSNAFNADEEEYTDTNNNGVCDNGEPYVDANLNETWDSDGGDEGQGGARDVAIVTVTVTYDRLFPLAKLIGLPEQITIAANTVLANQPYAEQDVYAAAQTRNCDD